MLLRMEGVERSFEEALRNAWLMLTGRSSEPRGQQAFKAVSGLPPLSLFTRRCSGKSVGSVSFELSLIVDVFHIVESRGEMLCLQVVKRNCRLPRLKLRGTMRLDFPSLIVPSPREASYLIGPKDPHSLGIDLDNFFPVGPLTRITLQYQSFLYPHLFLSDFLPNTVYYINHHALFLPLDCPPSCRKNRVAKDDRIEICLYVGQRSPGASGTFTSH